MPSLLSANAFGTLQDSGIAGALAALVPQDDGPPTRRPGVVIVDGARIELGRAIEFLPLSAVLEMAVSS